MAITPLFNNIIVMCAVRNVLLKLHIKKTTSFLEINLMRVFASMYSLANVDPIDVAKTITGLNPETTLGK